MSWSQILALVPMSTALGILGFVLGTYYKAKVDKSIQHRLDRQLEQFKAELRANEEALKSTLRSRDEQIGALRTNALSGMSSRHAALDKRRLEAIERVWAAGVDLGKFKIVATMTRTIKMELALDGAAQQDKDGQAIRNLAEMIWKTCGLENLKPPAAPPDNERPFVSPIVWARFSAYREVVVYPMLQLGVLRSGAGSKMLKDPKPLVDMAKASLPHYSKYLDEFGVSGLNYLVDDFEEALLREIMVGIEAYPTDSKSIEQADAIMKAADKVAAQSAPQVELPKVPGFQTTSQAAPPPSG